MLADIAVFITTIKEHLDGDTQNSKVILWGTRYGATLAVMARKKFPHLVDGVWASTGLFRAQVTDESMFSIAIKWYTNLIVLFM